LFIKISLVDTTEMREILVTRRVSGRWLYNAGVAGLHSFNAVIGNILRAQGLGYPNI